MKNTISFFALILALASTAHAGDTWKAIGSGVGNAAGNIAVQLPGVWVESKRIETEAQTRDKETRSRERIAVTDISAQHSCVDVNVGSSKVGHTDVQWGKEKHCTSQEDVSMAQADAQRLQIEIQKEQIAAERDRNREQTAIELAHISERMGGSAVRVSYPNGQSMVVGVMTPEQLRLHDLARAEAASHKATVTLPTKP